MFHTVLKYFVTKFNSCPEEALIPRPLLIALPMLLHGLSAPGAPPSIDGKLLKISALAEVPSGQAELMAISPDKQQLAVAWKVAAANKQPPRRQLQIYTTKTFDPIGQPKMIGDKNRTGSLCFGPNGTAVIVGIDYGFQVWDSTSDRRMSKSKGELFIWQTEAHPTANEIITNGGNASIRRWHLPSAKLVGTIKTPFERVVRTRLTTDGNRMLLVGVSSGVQCLQVRTFPSFRLLAEPIKGAPNRSITEIRISPSNDRFVVRRPAGKLEIGELQSGKLIGSIESPARPIHQFRFIDNRHMIATAGQNQPIWFDLDQQSARSIDGIRLASPAMEVLSSPPRLIATLSERGKNSICAWNLTPLIGSKKETEIRPKTPAGHLQAGLKRCLEENRWPEGLAHLTKCGDDKLKKLSQDDIDAERVPLRRLEVGERWEAMMKTATDEIKQLASAAATRSYTIAATTGTGLTKLRAQANLKRLSNK